MESMTPSKPITGGEIGKISELLGAALRKSGLLSLPTQHVLATPEKSALLVAGLLSVVQSHVEAVSTFIMRLAPVDRKRNPRDMLRSMCRHLECDDSMVDTMPRGEGEVAGVFFFKVGRALSDVELEKEYELRGLKPADPYSLAAVNRVHPDFAKTNPNVTHWWSGSNWCFASFVRTQGIYWIEVLPRKRPYGKDCWFAGLPK